MLMNKGFIEDCLVLLIKADYRRLSNAFVLKRFWRLSNDFVLKLFRRLSNVFDL